MSRRLLAGLTMLVSLAAAGDASAKPVRWAGNGHLYDVRAVPDGLSWVQAYLRVRAFGCGWYLATLTSKAEDGFVRGLVAKEGGIFDRDGGRGPWLGGLPTNRPGAPPPRQTAGRSRRATGAGSPTRRSGSRTGTRASRTTPTARAAWAARTRRSSSSCPTAPGTTSTSSGPRPASSPAASSPSSTRDARRRAARRASRSRTLGRRGRARRRASGQAGPDSGAGGGDRARRGEGGRPREGALQPAPHTSTCVPSSTTRFGGTRK